MRILFGIQTTGHGHLVRSSSLVRRLRELGCEVHALFSGPTPAAHWLERTGRPYELRDGLTFVHEGGRLRYVATAGQLKPVRFARDLARLPLDGYDLVVTDYEPITAWTAWLRGAPSVGLGHMYAFQHRAVPVARGNPLTRLVLRRFAPARIAAGCHWDHFGAPLVPPMLTDEIQHLERGDVDPALVLVYLNFEDPDTVVALLRGLPAWRFRFYARVPEARRVDNVEIVPIGRERFVEDLARCRGVICNAGFSLASEALHLGVRLLVKPLAVQIEQESNALALERLGLGAVMQRLDREAIAHWLESPQPAPQRYPDVTSAMLDWLRAGAVEPLESVSRRLWAASGPGNAAAAPRRATLPPVPGRAGATG